MERGQRVNPILIPLIILAIVFVGGCDNSEYQQFYETLNPVQEESEIDKEEEQNKCYRDSKYFCNRMCSEESGLILSPRFNFTTIDSMQFDKNNDSIIDGEEMREWDFIDRKFDRCYDQCREEEIYPCFR